MGLPETVGTAVNELFNGANVSMSLTLMLTRGAGAMIEGFGTDEQKALFVEKLYSGEWTGTMCLTEAQAGSDVGASTTKAIKQDDGSYAITGEKKEPHVIDQEKCIQCGVCFDVCKYDSVIVE